MSTLAHVFEAAGLATVALISVRPMAEKMRPPRALYGEFPLGRPLGVPGDAEFQHDVLQRAFALLNAPEVPVLVDHPTVIEADETPLACALPPRFDPDALPAADEARGLRKAYDRSVQRRGTTSVGRVFAADQIAEALEMFARIADGADWESVGLPDNDPTSAVHDIRSYYDEAALELANGPAPGPRAAEAWFYEVTEAGRLILAARAAMRDADAPRRRWFYLAPAHR